MNAFSVSHLHDERVLRHLEFLWNPIFPAFAFSLFVFLIIYFKWVSVLLLVIAFINLVAPKGAVLCCFGILY